MSNPFDDSGKKLFNVIKNAQGNNSSLTNKGRNPMLK